MKVITVEKPFSHAENGIEVIDYQPGEQVVSDRCAVVAVKQLKVAKDSKKTPEQFAEDQAKSESDSED